MNIKAISISAFILLDSLLGMHAGEAEAQKLAEMILRIEAIGEKDNPSMEDAGWLLNVIKSDDPVMHNYVFYDDGRGDRLLYSPPSHHAIWSLSEILFDPPYTYKDSGWKSAGSAWHSGGPSMTGERKRWIDWSKDNDLVLRSSAAEGLISGRIEDEKRRQAENGRLHLELDYREASLAALGTPVDFFTLEQMYTDGKTLPGDPALLAPKLFGPDSESGESQAMNSSRLGVASDGGGHRKGSWVETTGSKRLSVSLTVMVVVVVVSCAGLLMLVFRRSGRGKKGAGDNS
jgi:hypothetical protein